MGKKNRNKNAKSKANPSNGKTQQKAKTENQIEFQIVIEFDESEPESSHKIATSTTMDNLGITLLLFYRIKINSVIFIFRSSSSFYSKLKADRDMDKLLEPVIHRMDFGAKVTFQAIRTYVESESGSFDKDMKKAATGVINEKYNNL